MYEPYVPPAKDSDPGTPCRCVAEGVPCPWDCDRCPAECPEREAVTQPVAERSSYRSYRSRRRRTYTSTSSSSTSSSSSGGSSWRSGRSSGGSSGKSGASKKAGAGIGAAATAAAGGFGALSSGNDDTPDPTPDYSYHADSDTDPYQYGSDSYAVVDRAEAPVVSFRTRKDGRLVVVTGSWRDVDHSGTCEVEVTVTERTHRVIIEAGTDLTRFDVDRGETCPAPDIWATEKTVLFLDEPVGDRQVVTSGPLLEGGSPIDPPGLAPAPRAD